MPFSYFIVSFLFFLLVYFVDLLRTEALPHWSSNSQTRLRNALLQGPDGDVPNLWYNMKGAVVYEASKQHIDVERSLAIKIHADAAPTTKVDGMLTISWSSLHGRGTTKETKNVYATIPKSWNVELRDVFKRFAWAMNALIDGTYPSLDWQGKPAADAGRQLADGWRLAPFFCVSDWEFYSNVCGFPTGRGRVEMA